MSKLPYVVSGMLECAEPGLIVPGQIDEFRESLDGDLRAMGKDTLWVPGDELRQGMRSFCKSTELPVISLDNRYVDPEWVDGFVSVSRAVDERLQDAGYDSRVGTDALQVQLDRLGAQYNGKEIAVIDDVLFSGEMAAWLIGELRERGVRVAALYAAIAVGDGAEKLAEFGVDVSFGRLFADVDDELVEVDFTALPGSGRKIAGTNTSALYFDSRYGCPNKWMSIPDDEDWPSRFCVRSLLRNTRLLRSDAQIASFLGYQSGTTRESVSKRLAEALEEE